MAVYDRFVRFEGVGEHGHHFATQLMEDATEAMSIAHFLGEIANRHPKKIGRNWYYNFNTHGAKRIIEEFILRLLRFADPEIGRIYAQRISDRNRPLNVGQLMDILIVLDKQVTASEQMQEEQGDNLD